MGKVNAMNFLIKQEEILKTCSLDNICYVNNTFTTFDKTKEGIIISKEYDTLAFDELVGSWGATSEIGSSVELLVRIRIDNKYSKYFSYGAWALKGENLYYNQDDVDAKMFVDEILTKDEKLADGFQFKVILKGDAALRFVHIALRTKEYKETIYSSLPESVYYNVVRYNQNMVPEIGHEMCSATTTAMLLGFKGIYFDKEDEKYPHRYVAGLVADRGHNCPTFGNWVYNTVVMGHFGFDAYVKRLNSINELKYHLAKVGPCGASIRGKTGLYDTNGHLIVVCGYKEKDGKKYFICNDPNVNSRFGDGLFVYYEYEEEVFAKFWYGVIYAIE